MENLELNRKKVLYPLRLKKRKLAIEIFVDWRGRGKFESPIMALLFWMKQEARSSFLE